MVLSQCGLGYETAIWLQKPLQVEIKCEKVAKDECRSIQYIVEVDQLVTWASAVSPTLVMKTENCVYIVCAFSVYTFRNISTLHIGSYVATLHSWLAWHCQLVPLLCSRPRKAPKHTSDMLKLVRWLWTVRKNSSESSFQQLSVVLSNDQKAETSAVQHIGQKG